MCEVSGDSRGVYYYQWGDFVPHPTNLVESLSSSNPIFWSANICSPNPIYYYYSV